MFLKIFQVFFFLLSLFFVQGLSAHEKCKELFEGSLRKAQVTASSKSESFDKNLPRFVDIMEEGRLEKLWSSKAESPSLLSAFLPEEVSFIGHRLRESQESYLVKFPATGSAMIARAKYEAQGQQLETNISFSKEGLMDNLGAEKKWLVGPSSKGAVLFLHGGGTKSTGGHVAEALINHFQKHNISVISPDLPWHAEGPRTFMGTLDQEMLSLSDLAKKYIHPDIPLFIWGHSWGGTFAHRIMQMTGEREKGFFHKSLKGLIITSPAVDPAPGQSMKDKKRAYFKRLEEALQREDEMAPNEGNIFKQIVLDGKSSPIGQFFSSLTLAELNDTIPEHKGKNYLPALMIVGEGDSMVYLGFEDLFHNYYDQLVNVETHYLDKLPLITSNGDKAPERVGHLLSDYLGFKKKNPVNFELALDFMEKRIPEKAPVDKDKKAPLLNMLQLVQLWANDLSFREWAEKAYILQIKKTDYFKRLREEQSNRYRQLEESLYQYSPSAYLLRLLANNISAADFLRVRDDLIKPLSHLFSSLSVFYALLKTETLLEAQAIIEKLSKELPNRFSKKHKQNFMKDIFSLKEEAPDFQAVLAKYSYLSKEDLNNMMRAIQEIEIVDRKFKEIYIPSVEDYRWNSGLTDKEIQGRIQWIMDNIQHRLDLEEQRQAVGHEVSQLVKQLNPSLDKIRQIIKRLKLIIEEAFISPPVFLEKELEDSEKEFEDLYAFSETLGIQLEEEALSALEERDFSLEAVHSHLAPHRSMIDEFNRRYDVFIQNRKKLRQKLITAIKRDGFLSEEQDYLRKELYEDGGLYFQLNETSLLLAQKEVEKQELSLRIFELSEAYNQWLPYPALSEGRKWPVKGLLNIPDFNERLLEENKAQFQQILKNWGSQNSQVIPSLPD